MTVNYINGHTYQAPDANGNDDACTYVGPSPGDPGGQDEWSEDCSCGFERWEHTFLPSDALNERLAKGIREAQEGKTKSRPEFEKASERQVGGDHYKNMPIQPLDFIMKNDLPFAEANIVKYACRHKAKGGKQDLEKVIHYAQLAIEHYYPEEDN